MALYASLSLGLWHNTVFLHSFTLLPNNVTFDLYGA
jgi:hypothetical protein